VEQSRAIGGRLVAVRVSGFGAAIPGPTRLEPGPLALGLELDGLPVADLPDGARLRIGHDAIVEMASAGSESRSAGTAGGILELGEAELRPATVLEGGLVEPGAAVMLEAVALPVTAALDLHSFRPEDVPAVVAEYLEEARRDGLLEVRIVHGRGRGVQRAVVRRLLAGAPGVVEFADASPDRGGWGATLVRLRPPEREDGR
jgi:hypothetical protein